MTKITDLSSLTGASVVPADDLITVVDLSETGAARNKKMTFAELQKAFRDTDGTLAANSDDLFATQKAVKTAIATAVTGLLDLKGSTDCSANPNYPAASKGDTYIVSVAGKIGGASGTVVEVGDVYIASADNAGGTQASVGSSWMVVQGNILSGAGVTFASASDYRTGTDTTKALNSDIVWDAADLVALNDSGGNIAVDMSTGLNFSMTMDGDYNLSNPTNAKPGQSGCIVFTQDGTGTQTLTYSSNWKFAGGLDPSLSTPASSVDVLFYQVISSSVILGNLVKAIA